MPAASLSETWPSSSYVITTAHDFFGSDSGAATGTSMPSTSFAGGLPHSSVSTRCASRASRKRNSAPRSSAACAASTSTLPLRKFSEPINCCACLGIASCAIASKPAISASAASTETMNLTGLLRVFSRKYRLRAQPDTAVNKIDADRAKHDDEREHHDIGPGRVDVGNAEQAIAERVDHVQDRVRVR